MSGAGKTVCITGASGYIASWLVKLLLERGYAVKASVRDPKDPKKTEHLLKLEGAKERLHLFQANLLEDGSFDAAVEGCDGVFHTASPFYHNVTDPHAELIDPAVKGTLNVLGSCSKASSSIKRVVVTSSMAAVAYNGRPRNPDVVVDETWFSDPDLCRESKAWYVLSKTLAEEAAWKFTKEKAIDMVTINPAMVIGPLLQPTLNTSAEAIANLLMGHKHVQMLVLGGLMLRMLQMPTSKLLKFLQQMEDIVWWKELLTIQKYLRYYATFILHPTFHKNEKPFVPIYRVSKEKVKSLGIDYIPLEQSIKETVESLKEKNFIGLASSNM